MGLAGGGGDSLEGWQAGVPGTILCALQWLEDPMQTSAPFLAQPVAATGKPCPNTCLVLDGLAGTTLQ